MNVTQPVLRAGHIPDKWCSEKRLTSLKGTREGASSVQGRSSGPSEHGGPDGPTEVSGPSSVVHGSFEKEV